MGSWSDGIRAKEGRPGRRSPDREAMGLGRPEQSQEEEVAGDERVQ